MNRPEGISPEAWEKAIEAVGVPSDDNGWHLTTDLLEPIARAIQSSVEAERARLEREIKIANERAGNIETPLMRGDNLAITLCTHFDDGEPSDDDTGWSEAAIAGYQEVMAGIASHYLNAIHKGA